MIGGRKMSIVKKLYTVKVYETRATTIRNIEYDYNGNRDCVHYINDKILCVDNMVWFSDKKKPNAYGWCGLGTTCEIQIRHSGVCLP